MMIVSVPDHCLSFYFTYSICSTGTLCAEHLQCSVFFGMFKYYSLSVLLLFL